MVEQKAQQPLGLSSLSSLPPPPQFRQGWYEYPVRVQPHDTDYAGIVWHGAYLRWMEAARVECLRAAAGIDFANLVSLGCDLPVVDLHLHYHRAVPMGTLVQVKTRIPRLERVQIPWTYRIESLDGETLYLTGEVILVPVDRSQGKILRRLPTALREALQQLYTTGFAADAGAPPP
jgi:acyl-CoA thioester hydrolase